METDFVLIDVDFVKNNDFGTPCKYAALRDVYTITQRSRIGTIIKRDGLNTVLPGLTTERNPEVGQRVLMSEQDIATFKERRGKILETLNQNPDLYDYIHDLVSTVPSSPAVVPTPPPEDTTPPPPPPPPSPTEPTPPVAGGPPVPPAPTTPPTPPPSNGGNGGNGGSNPPGSNPTGNPPAPAPNPAIPPVAPGQNPVSYQQAAQAMATKGNSMIYNSQFKSFIYGPEFKQLEKSSNDSLFN